jgi:hypothetical protein
MIYSPPTVTELGSVRDLTLQELDKIGDRADFLTLLLPDLTGSFVPDKP